MNLYRLLGIITLFALGIFLAACGMDTSGMPGGILPPRTITPADQTGNGAMKIDTLNPSGGPKGTVIEVSGQAFAPDIKALLDGKIATSTFVSDTTIKVTVADLGSADKDVDLRLERPSGEYVEVKAAFHYRYFSKPSGPLNPDPIENCKIGEVNYNRLPCQR